MSYHAVILGTLKNLKAVYPGDWVALYSILGFGIHVSWPTSSRPNPEILNTIMVPEGAEWKLYDWKSFEWAKYLLDGTKRYDLDDALGINKHTFRGSYHDTAAKVLAHYVPTLNILMGRVALEEKGKTYFRGIVVGGQVLPYNTLHKILYP